MPRASNPSNVHYTRTHVHTHLLIFKYIKMYMCVYETTKLYFIDKYQVINIEKKITTIIQPKSNNGFSGSTDV